MRDWIDNLTVELMASHAACARFSPSELRQVICDVVERHTEQIVLASDEATLIETEVLRLLKM